MRRLAALVLALVALAAPILAAANVPDPSWVPGMYDGGDADEILALVWDGTPAIAAQPPTLLEPHAVILAPAPPIVVAPPRPVRCAACRAPPLV